MRHDSLIQKTPILKVKLQRNVLYSSVHAQHSFNIASKERKKAGWTWKHHNKNFSWFVDIIEL